MKLVDNAVVNLNNLAVRARRKRCAPGELLLLVPHCMQRSDCKQRITHDLGECQRCGKCQISDIIGLGEEFGVRCIVVSGGRLALAEVQKDEIRGVVAVACEKELRTGILAALPKAVFGVVNLRPHGPCKDTCVTLDEVRRAIEWFLR